MSIYISPIYARPRTFYHGVLGFDIIQRYGPSALFVSADGYHHHIGLNTWAGGRAAATARLGGAALFRYSAAAMPPRAIPCWSVSTPQVSPPKRWHREPCCVIHRRMALCSRLAA